MSCDFLICLDSHQAPSEVIVKIQKKLDGTFIHRVHINKCLYSTYHVLGTMEGTEGEKRQIRCITSFQEAYVLIGEIHSFV